MRFGLLTCVFLLSVSTADAQTRVGTALVDGRIVELFSDQTWQFRDQAETGCQPVAKGIAFCDASGEWTRVEDNDPDIAAQFRYDDRHYGQYIEEALGIEDGLTLSVLRGLILQNAADASGVPVADVVVYDVVSQPFAGRDAETVTYGVRISGLDVIFKNTIVSAPRRTIQVVTYAIGAAPTATHDGLHSRFLEATEIED